MKINFYPSTKYVEELHICFNSTKSSEHIAIDVGFSCIHSEYPRFTGTMNGRKLGPYLAVDGRNIFSHLMRYYIDFHITSEYYIINIYFHPETYFETEIEIFKRILRKQIYN